MQSSAAPTGGCTADSAPTAGAASAIPPSLSTSAELLRACLVSYESVLADWGVPAEWAATRERLEGFFKTVLVDSAARQPLARDREAALAEANGGDTVAAVVGQPPMTTALCPVDAEIDLLAKETGRQCGLSVLRHVTSIATAASSPVTEAIAVVTSAGIANSAAACSPPSGVVSRTLAPRPANATPSANLSSIDDDALATEKGFGLRAFAAAPHQPVAGSIPSGSHSVHPPAAPPEGHPHSGRPSSIHHHVHSGDASSSPAGTSSGWITQGPLSTSLPAPVTRPTCAAGAAAEAPPTVTGPRNVSPAAVHRLLSHPTATTVVVGKSPALTNGELPHHTTLLMPHVVTGGDRGDMGDSHDDLTSAADVTESSTRGGGARARESVVQMSPGSPVFHSQVGTDDRCGLKQMGRALSAVFALSLRHAAEALNLRLAVQRLEEHYTADARDLRRRVQQLEEQLAAARATIAEFEMFTDAFNDQDGGNSPVEGGFNTTQRGAIPSESAGHPTPQPGCAADVVPDGSHIQQQTDEKERCRASSDVADSFLAGPASLVPTAHRSSLNTTKQASSQQIASRAFLKRLSSSLVSAAYGPVVRTTHADIAQDDNDDDSIFVNQYWMYKVLGAGCQGVVRLAIDTQTNEMRAIKEIPRTYAITARQVREQVERDKLLRREIAIMKRCRHRNVVALYEVIDDPDAQAMYLVMQHVDKGAIAKQRPDGTVTPLPPDQVASFAHQLCAGLLYLHSHGVVHRDIKPENILLNSDGTVALADFGISSLRALGEANPDTDDASEQTSAQNSTGVAGIKERVVERSGNSDRHVDAAADGIAKFSADSDVAALPAVAVTRCDPAARAPGPAPPRGTAAFLAPEMLRTAASGPDQGARRASETWNSAGEPLDVWALGVSLFVLLFGRLPYDFSSAPTYLAAVASADPVTIPDSGPGGETLADEWRDLLKCMLDKSPSQRATALEAHKVAKRLSDAYERRRQAAEATVINSAPTRHVPPPQELDDALCARTKMTAWQAVATAVQSRGFQTIPSMGSMSSSSHCEPEKQL